MHAYDYNVVFYDNETDYNDDDGDDDHDNDYVDGNNDDVNDDDNDNVNDDDFSIKCFLFLKRYVAAVEQCWRLFANLKDNLSRGNYNLLLDLSHQSIYQSYSNNNDDSSNGKEKVSLPLFVRRILLASPNSSIPVFGSHNIICP
uniref:Uncharacterized protein n=1 Tax=Glossina pallidipes TaxID=7398 RepID=A0A1A9Z956_GLOPL